MGEGITIIISIGLIIGFVLLIRLLGAWMLRIDEVIKLLRDIRSLLKNGTPESKYSGKVDDEIIRKAALYDKHSRME